jgi:hypothetical protein
MQTNRSSYGNSWWGKLTNLIERIEREENILGGRGIV